jgi:hypothetical protein
VSDHAETLERMARDNGFLSINRDQQAACAAGAEALRECARLRARVQKLEAELAELLTGDCEGGACGLHN